jgi:hypothetical protein
MWVGLSARGPRQSTSWSRPEARLILSVFPGAILEVLLSFSDYPLEVHGPST